MKKHLCATEVLECANELVKRNIELFFQDNFNVIQSNDDCLKIKNKLGMVLTITSNGGFGYNEGLSWLQYEFNYDEPNNQNTSP